MYHWMSHQQHYRQPQPQCEQKTVTQNHTEGDTNHQMQRHQDVHDQLQHMLLAQQQPHPLEPQPSSNAPAAAASCPFAPPAAADGELRRQAEHNGTTQQVVMRARQPSIRHHVSSSYNCFDPQVIAREAEVERVDVTRRAHVLLLHPTSQHASPPPLPLACNVILQHPSNVALAADAATCGAGAQQKHGATQVHHVGCSACMLGRFFNRIGYVTIIVTSTVSIMLLIIIIASIAVAIIV